MMGSNNLPLVGSEIHGFHTMADLDVGSIMEEAKGRWLRPNEIYAILCNQKYFTINAKPMNLPKGGTIVLFDRKMLRNFRKDGHNWKKNKDGKTVKEAHEHLKVGNKERVHVYYAHGEDNPTFVRRCYWLLDKSRENVVLVHYRETQEGSPVIPGNSISSSAVSDPSPSLLLSEKSDSAIDRACYNGSRSLLGHQDPMTLNNHERRLHEINTFDWDELLVPDDSHKLVIPQEGGTTGFEPANQYLMNSLNINDNALSTNKVSLPSTADSFSGHIAVSSSIDYTIPNNVSYQTNAHERIVDTQTLVSGTGTLSGVESLDNIGKDNLQSQDNLGRWMSYILADSPGPVDGEAQGGSSISTEHQTLTSSLADNHQSPAPGEIFYITDISPAWALSTEETKILVVGVFNEGQLPQANNNLYLACGDSVVSVEVVQPGVFRCKISPQTPGLVNLYLSFDGYKPISQVLSFEFRAPAVSQATMPQDNISNWEEFLLKIRLARLLFSSSNTLRVFASELSPSAIKEAETFVKRTSNVSNGWIHLTKMMEASKLSSPQAKDSLFELTLQNRLQEWLLEKVVAGSKIYERDAKGQGVIHLCAILGYTWAVYPFSCSGLSIDFRDKHGWTALHWAAYYGREKMVAILLSAGAKPNLVTDPTPENPGGCTAADLASKNGFDGLAAYLAEKGLVAQFNDMTLAGNVSGSLQTTSSDTVTSENFTEEELYLKDTLAAYRTAADAAARIQTAFRDHSLKVRTKTIESSNPEIEARNIVAAMKIQHAFRNYESRKKIAAAARIQYRFRTWKIRKDFLNKRRQAIKIQAAFRGYQTRRQYSKIVWSVGVLEKAVLRWRLKRKGFRGLQVQPEAAPEDPNKESDAEEDFFQDSRKQAEERVERSVVKVQAMFRSRRAQEDYRRMKLEHNKATIEYDELLHPDVDMVTWGKK